jgi:hypothetical protein
MHHPAIIRTEFASAEDAAELYGVPESRVKTIQEALTHTKKLAPQERRSGFSTKTAIDKPGTQATPLPMIASRGKKRSAKRK